MPSSPAQPGTELGIATTGGISCEFKDLGGVQLEMAVLVQFILRHDYRDNHYGFENAINCAGRRLAGKAMAGRRHEPAWLHCQCHRSIPAPNTL
jgi:hypothetical protein